MKKLENGLVVIESFVDIGKLYTNGELENNNALVICNMAGKHTKYCVSVEFWRKLKNKVDLRSNDRSILCKFNNELVRISYSDPRYTILIITVEKASVYEVDELE